MQAQEAEKKDKSKVDLGRELQISLTGNFEWWDQRVFVWFPGVNIY